MTAKIPSMMRGLAVAGAAMALAACAPEAADAPADAAATGPVGAREPASVAALIATLPEFSTFRRMLTDSGRIDGLRGRGGVTLLAPRDTAFARLAPESRAAILAPGNRDALTRTIELHIIPRIVTADELRQAIGAGGGSVQMASRGGTLTFTLSGDLIIVTAPSGASASMGSQHVATGNGSVYVLDRWLGSAATEG